MLKDSRAFSFKCSHLFCHPQFLLAWQAFERTFRAQCLSFAVERPGRHERDRSVGSGVAPSLSGIVQSNASLDIDGVAGVERPISAADHVDVVCLQMRYVLQTPLLVLVPLAPLTLPGLRVPMRIREDALLVVRLLFGTVQTHWTITSSLALFLLLLRAIWQHLTEVTELTVERIAQRLNGLKP